jgi:hypothetical protein
LVLVNFERILTGSQSRLEPGVIKSFDHGHDDLVIVTATTITGRDRNRESRLFFLICRDSQLLLLNYVYCDEG